MSVLQAWRQLFFGVVIGAVLTACPLAWADGEADQIARANQLIEDKRYDDAIAILIPLTSSADPIGRQANEALESACRHAGQWSKAVPILESLARDYPADTSNWKALLGTCYRNQGDYSKAVAAFKESLEAGPSTPSAQGAVIFALWLCCQMADDWAPAVSVYESLLAKRPEDAAEWHYQLYRCYGKMGKSAEADAALRKAMEAVKSDPAKQIARAHQLIEEKKYDRAVAILTPLTSGADPVARQAKEALEGCYRRMGQWEKAISILESLVSEYPADMAAWLSPLATCYRTTGDYPKAIALIKKGLDLTPATPHAATCLAENLYRCYLATGDWEAAVPVYQSLLDKQAQYASEWRFQLGRCYWKMAKNTEAVAEMEKAMESVNSDPEAVKRMGRELVEVYTEAGELAKAEALRESVYPRDQVAQQAIQRAYQLQNNGDYAKAIDAFRDFIDRFADYLNHVESAHVCIAECLHQMGKPDEGMAYAKKLYDEQPEMRAGALFAQGMLSSMSSKYNDSVAPLQRVISEYPSNMHAGLAHGVLASAFEKTGRTGELIDLLRAIVAAESSPDKKAASLLRIGSIYYDAKRHRDAIKAFTEVRTLKSARDEAKAQATYRSGLCYHEIE